MNVVFFGFKRQGIAYLDDAQAHALRAVEVRANDVLLNITGASIGRVTRAPADMDGARVNQHVCIIRPNAAVDARFLSAYLSSPKVQRAITAENYGVTRQALTKEQLLGFEIPLAPLQEQVRIADKLDAMLARLDTCRDRLDRVPAILKRFREAVLSAAVKGQLTQSWRETNEATHTATRRPGPQLSGFAVDAKPGDQQLEKWLDDLPESWRVERASQVVQSGADIVYGIVQPGPKLAEGVPYVRGLDIVDGEIRIDQLLRTSPDIAQRYARASIKGGDVLLGIIRATKVAVVPDSLNGANITQGTARFRPSGRMLTRYLAAVLEAPETQRWLHGHYRGIDMPGLNLADVRRVPIPLPSLEEQAEVVRRVDSLLCVNNEINARLATVRDQVSRLTPALLAKAFRGELVPQDPTDEPAAMLLARLQSGRQTSGSAPAARRPESMRTQPQRARV
jgi:type I restriction enzyme, S subunit